MKLLAAIMLMASLSFSQQILKPRLSYTFDSTMVAYTEQQFRKNETLLDSLDLYRLKNKSLTQQLAITRQIEDSLKVALVNQMSKSLLLQNKIDLMSANDSLRMVEVNAYKGLFTETNKTLIRERGRIGNGTFWYVMGFLSGAATIYVSSVVLHNSTSR